MIPAADLFHTYQKAEGLLASGDLKKAADLCKSLLEANPDFAWGYHLMSSLFRATGAFDKALMFAEIAIEKAPDEAMFHFQYGQILFSLEYYLEATAAFERAHQLNPKSPFALLLKASAHVQMKQFDIALDTFNRARAIEDIPEIDEHEGLCMMMQGNMLKAEILFDRLVQRKPDYAWGHVHKGKILVEKKQYGQAEACFARALSIHPKMHEALHGMAMVHETLNHLEEAGAFALQAVNANPMSVPSLMLLGFLMLRQKKPSAAEQVFRQAALLAPESVYVLHGLANALLQQRKLSDALPYVEEVLKVRPDNVVMQYFHALISGQQVETAPREYVHELFDAYADDFDHHLQERLAYKTPTVVADAICALPSMKGRTGLSLLDLGCGTGLGAEALRAVTRKRIGVDLSPKMLDKAQVKKLYDELHALDVCEFMTGYESTFDIVTAMDVLVYIGNLSPFFQSARNVMAQDSVLAFTIEKADVDTFLLNPTGRYSHSRSYVMTLAKEEGFELLAEQEITVRTEFEQPVKGYYFIFKKTPMH